ncbi:MAG: 5-carboxymethyl-2-hydroxymuconate semialdehyde dehydrogenase, partial [Hyphomicrobiales bacterium]|nr:5-carboxymethyl-2-hydroxymuconate semialdehyde dehydrogenase [Hyphomicrobiales bacterium]
MNKLVANDAFLANMAAAERHLERFRGACVGHLIAGAAELGTGATFDDLSPVDNSTIAKIAAGGPAEIDAAAKAATAAFP